MLHLPCAKLLTLRVEPPQTQKFLHVERTEVGGGGGGDISAEPEASVIYSV